MESDRVTMWLKKKKGSVLINKLGFAKKKSIKYLVMTPHYGSIAWHTKRESATISRFFWASIHKITVTDTCDPIHDINNIIKPNSFKIQTT